VEILAEITNWDEYLAGVFLAFVGCLLILISSVILLTSVHQEKVVFKIFVYLMIVLANILVVLYTVSIILIGPEVTYKATINDFNEVHRNGYEIIGSEGKIFILRKSDMN
jgi:hypothetical protein